MPSALQKPPPVVVGTYPHGYSLAGWPEFERWMMRNDARFRATVEAAERHGMTDRDVLRLLVATFVSAKYDFAALYLELTARSGLPPLPVETLKPEALAAFLNPKLGQQF